jgi:hypothetical protein
MVRAASSSDGAARFVWDSPKTHPESKGQSYSSHIVLCTDKLQQKRCGFKRLLGESHLCNVSSQFKAIKNEIIINKPCGISQPVQGLFQSIFV